MDRRERLLQGPLAASEAFFAGLTGLQANLWTAMPGKVSSVENLAAQGTIDVQPTIRSVILGSDGKPVSKQLPVLPDCPVVMMGGGGFTTTYPIAKDDECLIVIANRCIDNWWANGDIQDQAEPRMHDLSDGFAIVGLRSRPRWLTGYDTKNVQMRSDDGKSFIEMTPDGDINATAQLDINLTASGSINLTAGKGISLTAGLGVTLDAQTDITATTLTQVVLNAPTTIVLNTPVVEIAGVVQIDNENNVVNAATFTGSLHVQQGEITADRNITAGMGTADQVGLQTHTHSDPDTLQPHDVSAPNAGT